MKTILRRLAVIAVMMLVTVGITTAVNTAPAQASTVSYVQNYHGGSVAMRYAPTTNANVENWMPNGTKFHMSCWTDFQWFNGNYSSPRWFWGQAYNTGQWGYVHSSYVLNQTSVPRC